MLAGCVSTGVVKTKPDEYKISKIGAGVTADGGSKVLAELYVTARAYCAEYDEAFNLIAEEVRTGDFFKGENRVVLHFRCIPHK